MSCQSHDSCDMIVPVKDQAAMHMSQSRIVCTVMRAVLLYVDIILLFSLAKHLGINLFVSWLRLRVLQDVHRVGSPQGEKP